MNYPNYSDDSSWNELIEKYFGYKDSVYLIPGVEREIWDYFKHCLKTKNRYFFQHPLLDQIASEIKKRIFILGKENKIFRARNDDERKLFREYLRYSQIISVPEELERLKEYKIDQRKLQKLNDEYNAMLSDPDFIRIKMRLESGFQGFDADGCGAPSSEKTRAGRCNLEGVAYLYAAQEEHTAVAEIRPFYDDTVSVAVLKPLCDLMLVNLDYNPTETVSGKGFFFREIQEEFSLVHKEKKNDYLITQFITSYIESLGYDGLCFRSSLVKDGTNYVIFRPSNCVALSSKLVYLSEVRYIYGQFPND